MKKTVLASVFLFFAGLGILKGDSKIFLRDVNERWAARDYDNLFVLASAKAEGADPLPEALAVLVAFHIIVDGDREKAINALDRLLSILETSYVSGYAAGNKFKKTLLDASDQNAHPRSQVQLNALHELSPDEFPVGIVLMFCPISQ